MKTGNGRAASNSSGLGHRQYLGSGPVSPPRPPGAADSQIVRDGRMQRLQLQGLTEVLLQYLAGPRPRRDDALRRRELPLVGVQHHRVPAAGEQPHQEAVAPLLDPLHLHVVLQDAHDAFVCFLPDPLGVRFRHRRRRHRIPLGLWSGPEDRAGNALAASEGMRAVPRTQGVTWFACTHVYMHIAAQEHACMADTRIALSLLRLHKICEARSAL